ncbi:rhamnogalacturonan acetylesterase [Parahaliea aestuarii]|uniref:Rhamnogalacturonan acetylesterase n=1 Tax=Parahaliea aestuarii TaxID=1852021 RepID=A0A5C9A0S7_9GAMM|nr:rhamnogalacturonan acetylesterase [Parahaliea aestuarii]TXS94475.1 rhamnogalacturonan acetylesterase [Parahaliea aestuarii]
MTTFKQYIPFGALACAILLLLAPLAARAEPITLFLAGDSTIAAKRPSTRPETGWGEALQGWFDPSAVTVDNHARNGRSTRTFIEEGRWQAIVDALSPGDYVFIQFGHNDGSEEKLDRYTPPADYRSNLARFVADVRQHQAHPVLMTPVMRRRFDERGSFFDTHGPYPGLVRELAREQAVPLLDMHRDSGALLLELGAQGSKPLFLILPAGEWPNYPEGLDDNTHFSPQGAKVMAAIVTREIREALPALAHQLRDTPAAD